MPKTTEDLEARNKQSEDSKRATFDSLKNKKRKEREVVIKTGDDEISLLLRAIGYQDYDKLITKNPPTQEQKADGSYYDINEFGPELLSKVCIDPLLTKKEWKEIWNSEDWSKGEMSDLFMVTASLCNKGLDIPLSDQG